MGCAGAAMESDDFQIPVLMDQVEYKTQINLDYL
jgi:hypothetical protein